MNVNSTQNSQISRVLRDPSPGLLISARSIAESIAIVAAGGTWLDVKEPNLGSLGRPPLDLIFSILELDIPERVQVSIAGGELVEWSDELDFELAAKLPARTYLKLALAGCEGSEWKGTADRISRALARRSQLILVHYADSERSQSPSWQEVLETTKTLGGKYVLIDTHCKKSGGLLDYYSHEKLGNLIHLAKQLKLSVALAGSLKLEQLQSLSKLPADWLGVRGAVCQDTLRTGGLCPDRMKQALSLIPQRKLTGS